MKHLIAVGVTIGLGLLPVPLDAATKEQPHKMTSVRITERAPAPAHTTTDQTQGLKLRQFPNKLRSQHRQSAGARREAAALRQWYRTPMPSLAQPQKTRLLQSGQIRLIDGDTFAHGTERIRIKGINTPETTEAGGFEATQRLDLLLHEGPVLVIPYGKDTYGRTLAEVYVNNRNVAEVMKEEGHAKTAAH